MHMADQIWQPLGLTSGSVLESFFLLQVCLKGKKSVLLLSVIDFTYKSEDLDFLPHGSSHYWTLMFPHVIRSHHE